MLNNSVEVGILLLQDLMQPVDQLDIRVAPHLAEDGGALDRPVAQAVEFAEQCDAADLAHNVLLKASSGRWPSTRIPQSRPARHRAQPLLPSGLSRRSSASRER